MRRSFAWLSPLACCLLGSCSVWFFSGERDSWIDRSRPVALLETTGGVEFGATTEFGILSLGRTATEGPCLVHYFLGPTPLIEDGTLGPTGSVFTAADIDLKTQAARALDRSPNERDTLSVMWTPDGIQVRHVSVELARGEGLSGDILMDPGVELPAGATVLCRGPRGKALFAGLIAGRAKVQGTASAGSYYVFAGVDRVREMLAVARPIATDEVPKYRNDDIRVIKQVKPAAVPPPGTAPAGVLSPGNSDPANAPPISGQPGDPESNGPGGGGNE